MKNLMVGLIVFLCGSIAFAQAEPEVGKVQLVNSFRLRAEGDEKTDLSTNRDFMPLRIRSEIKYTYDSTLAMVLTPQFSKTFGEPSYTLAPNTGAASQQQTGGATTDPTFFVHQGYMLYSPSENVAMKMGRQVLSYGDELVIGALDWNNIGRSFDAVSVRTSIDTFWADVFFSKLVDNNTVTNGSGDINLFGLYASKKWNPDSPIVLDAYFFYRDDSSVTPNTALEAAGLRSTFNIVGIDARLEMTKEFGTFFPDDSGAYQFDGELGHLFEGALKPRLSAEYFLAGKTYNQLYPTTHKWLGYADVLGRANVTGFVVHGKLALGEKTSVAVDGHYFSRASSDAPAYKVNGTSALGTATGSPSNFLGTEGDIILSHQISKPLMISGGFSYFSAGGYLTDQFGSTNPLFYYFQMEAKF